MSVKITRNPETGNITRLLLKNVTFSYAYLTSPRGEDDFKAGTYGADLLFSEPETFAAIKEYIAEIIEYAKENTWEGKLPKNLYLPISKGDEENELEAGKWKLKTSTKRQPQLAIRPEGSKIAHEVSEDELDEIYSGMIGEAIVSLRAYNYNNIKGITAYINAVCKTGAGTVLGGNTSYVDEFSDPTAKGTDFDLDEELNTPGLAPAKAPATKAPAKAPATKAPAKAATKTVEDVAGELDIDSLIKPKGKAAKPVEPVEEEFSLDDLLNQ